MVDTPRKDPIETVVVKAALQGDWPKAYHIAQNKMSRPERFRLREALTYLNNVLRSIDVSEDDQDDDGDTILPIDAETIDRVRAGSRPTARVRGFGITSGMMDKAAEELKEAIRKASS